MLRILVFDEPFSVKMRLEGELTNKTTSQLIQHWVEVQDRLRDRKAILDLGDVVEFDEAGREALGELADAGVRFGYAHPKLQPIVDDLNCRQQRDSSRLSALSRNGSSSLTRRVLYRLMCTVLPSRFRPCGCRSV